ncbi:IS200/IS605 family transposase [Candidatus Villigracilis saccharophilus]|uniref:IS200/IS605 family transposase n=1 Tax=Candidatus Villigracilis saccharophilus TaxID=3140684 RepID=UPI00313554DD|nr:IS200/IS605 family transposase [Anaerolineales bacterium]
MPYWKLYYHFIWGTRNRLPLIDSVIEAEVYRAIAAKATDMGGFVHAIGRVEDHVHLVASIPPKIAPAKFIGDVKGNSSHFINHVIKPDFEFYWQDEYGVLSFGEKNLSSVVRYVQNQKQHHADGALIPAMEQMDEI